jgi:hypothetical protein
MGNVQSASHYNNVAKITDDDGQVNQGRGHRESRPATTIAATTFARLMYRNLIDEEIA